MADGGEYSCSIKATKQVWTLSSPLLRRVLVIVGASHKPYFDAYLGMMHEVRLDPASSVLGK